MYSLTKTTSPSFRTLGRSKVLSVAIVLSVISLTTSANAGSYERPMGVGSSPSSSVLIPMVPSGPLSRSPSSFGSPSIQLTQSDQFKSRREVIEQVERDYNAKVLKITLNRRAGVYEIRILQENGRVSNITVSAKA